jgi:hypothetical protein
MKKIIVCLLVLFVAGAMYAADPIQLGNFPVGQWIDHNYNVIWDFATNNIRILSTDGTVLYNFSGKTIQDFKVFLEGSQPGMSFSCTEAGRSYRFVKTLTDTDLIMTIERSGLPAYTITMKKR